jgi:coenzyme F420 hydrogenase subunit beta
MSWQKLTALLKKKRQLDRVTGMDIPPSRYHTLEVYTTGETVRISLDEVDPCVREACRTCADMTAEFSDLSVGSARLPEGWETARSWNQVIVRTERGMDLMERARRRGILEFRTIPPGNLEKLKAASLGKKRTAVSRLAGQGHTAGRTGQAG